MDKLTSVELCANSHVLASPVLSLPPELLHQIFSHLSARDLAHISITCRTLADHAKNELLWMDLVNSYLPFRIHEPKPFDSFRSLYVAHYPCWFIPKGKIWFSDKEHTGSLILARYDQQEGAIEAYRIVAERRSYRFQAWNWNPNVTIQTFHPKVSLWMDDPVLLLKGNPSGLPGAPRCFDGEIRMPMARESQNVFSSFAFCSTEIPSDTVTNSDRLWPPITIPSDCRVFRGPGDLSPEWPQPPRDVSRISEYAFRLRKWPYFGMGTPPFVASDRETLVTYATIDHSLYTPTKTKPFQGIWIGDYSAHGSEFILFLQHDNEAYVSDSSPSSAAYQTNDTGDPETFGTGASDIIYQGRLEAIKLTGDPNVPRGEISWVAEDIGRGGVIRTADDHLFKGARVVHSRGHVASLGFRDETFIPSQLILISPDLVAHYWEAMAHVSYFRRVDIDSLIRM